MRRHTWRPWATGVVRLPSRGAHLSGGEPAAADFGSAPCVGVGRTQMRGAPVPPAPPNPDRRSLSASSSRSPSQPPSCDPPRLQGEHHIPVDRRCCASVGPSSSNPQNIGGQESVGHNPLWLQVPPRNTLRRSGPTPADRSIGCPSRRAACSGRSFRSAGLLYPRRSGHWIGAHRLRRGGRGPSGRAP